MADQDEFGYDSTENAGENAETSEQDDNLLDEGDQTEEQYFVEEERRVREYHPNETSGEVETGKIAPLIERLVITVIGVKNVAAMDFNGKSDPFIKVFFGGEEKQTKKQKDTLNAEYNEMFIFDRETSLDESEPVQSGTVIESEKEFKLELWDYDTIGDNDQIGQVVIPTEEFLNKQQKKTFIFKGVDKLYGQNVGEVDIEVLYEKSG
ncbi:MAG: hypothetical protein EZS28_015063, partial [Streblomastix strix]